ncbi:ATP12 family chaperone protein [Lichenibacterium dinghuense]|uniref:ATP12 family chaperone protein n=1 Tax=Lichenibacterium dinghuense TaxID=2895977 RepID=UPI001F2D9644|nr:ATP12 family protein [Lichenibacterium sp. 6Y81]
MVHEPGPMIPGRQAPPPKPKRFYAEAAAEERDGAFALVLDGRAAKTPAKRPLALPSRAAAEAVAAEWNAQVEVIDPARMPLTRLCNTAIDGVAEQMAAVADEVRTYLTSDLLAYRAADPAPLVLAQARAWDPVLDWAREAHGARFVLAEGITFVAQPPATLAAMGSAVDGVVGSGAGAPFRLAALDVMTTLTGSALLALAVMQARLTPEDAWAAAHVDELFQESQWGADAEALERRERRWADMRAAAMLGRLAG